MLNKKRKGLSNIALAALVFAGTFNGFYRPVNVYASEDYHSWRQMDERWAGIRIGNTTIGASGCLVTSIAIMAVHSGSKSSDDFNPAVFANAVNGINGFDSYGALSWSAVSSVIPDVEILGVNNFRSYDEKGKIDEIRSVMEDGYYVICNVGNHWVFVEDVTETDVYMIDPAKDDVLMFDSYSNYNITQYEILTGKNPPSFSADTDNSSTVTTTFTTETTTTSATTTSEITTTSATTTFKTTTIEETTTSATTTSETTTAEETTTSATTTSETTTAEETTTSATTTSETTTTEETTVTATTTIPAVTETVVSDSSSEFYYSGEETTCIFTDAGEIVAEIQTGNMVNVKEIRNGYGLVTVDGQDGWIDMDKMVFHLDWFQPVKGDINKDGVINIYDLSLINEYIKSRELLPDGVSILSQSEIETADINGDGVVDNGDVIEYLSIICG